MRIGIFTDTYLPYVSGLVTSELMLKRALEKLGHTVYIVTANLDNFKYINDEENKIIYIPGLPIGIYDARLTGIYSGRAINQIRKWKLDIIHSQTEFGIGTFSRLVSKQLNIPLVHTYHTMYEDYIYYITKGYFDKTSKRFVEYLTKFYCDKTVTELIVPSRKIYNIFVNKYEANKKINIIGTGMDIERFDKTKFSKELVSKYKKQYGIKEKDFVIGTVARVAKEKSIDKIIETYKTILESIPNSKLLIVGDGPDREELQQLTRDLGIEDNVIFTLKVPIETVQIYYQLMDVYVTFSTTETQGLTVLEAMAASLPVLAIRDDSFVDAVEHKVNGYLFKTDKEYIDEVLGLYNDKKLYKEMSDKSLELSKNHSSLEFGKQVFEVYKDTIKTYNEKKLTNQIKNIFSKSSKEKKEKKNK
ncbi:MAG: glycosyltransferase [Bacilli bacterium]|nr:glycosyltransferase [Bacilli bacterium]